MPETLYGDYDALLNDPFASYCAGDALLNDPFASDIFFSISSYLFDKSICFLFDYGFSARVAENWIYWKEQIYL